MSQPTPTEVLDRALGFAPGVGEPIEFAGESERESFRFRLYAAMSADARRSERLDAKSDPNWGKHRWSAVRIERVGDNVLWIGRALDFKTGEPTTLGKAREGRAW